MSPRRTRPTQRKRRVVVEAVESAPRPNTDQMARDLVRRGLADPLILGVRDFLRGRDQ